MTTREIIKSLERLDSKLDRGLHRVESHLEDRFPLAINIAFALSVSGLLALLWHYVGRG